MDTEPDIIERLHRYKAHDATADALMEEAAATIAWQAHRIGTLECVRDYAMEASMLLSAHPATKAGMTLAEAVGAVLAELAQARAETQELRTMLDRLTQQHEECAQQVSSYRQGVALAGQALAAALRESQAYRAALEAADQLLSLETTDEATIATLEGRYKALRTLALGRRGEGV